MADHDDRQEEPGRTRPPVPVGPAYAGVRARVSALVAGASPAALERAAPATPGWRVRDVLAHLVGVTCDAVEGRLEGVATPQWTAAQVERRRASTVSDLLAEWAEHGPRFEAALDAISWRGPGGQAVFDAVTHEHDIRHALGAAGARASDAVVLAWEWLGVVRTRARRPALRFVTEAGVTDAGSGSLVATVRAPRFELVRAAAGRRSASEIAAYDWTCEREAELLAEALLVDPEIFSLRAEPLGE